MTSPIYVLLTTYNRLECARKTIQGVKENVGWSNIGWVITDDGSGGDYLQQLKDEIGPSYSIHTYDGKRKGVGHNMNYGLKLIFNELSAELVLLLEDDWYIQKPLDFTPYVNLLKNSDRFGMIRFGYLSAGLQATLIAEENKLWWQFKKTDYQYTFAGHASLRHKRFFDVYGYYEEGLKPGMTELDMCGKFNAKEGPAIVWDADFPHMGPFAHIGSESLADVEPEV